MAHCRAIEQREAQRSHGKRRREIQAPHHKTKADKREWLGGDKAEPLNVHYTVSGGAWQKLGNDNWVQQVEIRSHGFRKNSVVYSMSNAAN